MEHESSAIESLAKTRQRLSPCKSKRVCVVSHGSVSQDKTDEYKFYIVDCDSSSIGGGGGDEYTFMEPNIRFKSKGRVAFCALKSTLYMFEGDDHRPPGRGGSEGPRFAGKFVIPEEIYLRSSGCYNLEKKELVRIKDMHDKKFSIEALPTPDGKSILVFSSGTIPSDDWTFRDRFELYNADEDSWEVLPGLPSKCNRSSYSCRIKAYGFESESRFRIEMENEIFVLDLKASPRAWEQSRGCNNPCADDGFFLGIGGFDFTPDLVYSRDGYYGMQHLCLSSFPDDDAYGKEVPMYERYRGRIFPSIASLGRKDGVYDYDFGVVHAQCHPHHMTTRKNLRVILDIFRPDIEKYKRVMDEHNKRVNEEYKKRGKHDPALRIFGPSVQPANVIKTIKFMIDYDFYNYMVGQMHLFSV